MHEMFAIQLTTVCIAEPSTKQNTECYEGALNSFYQLKQNVPVIRYAKLQTPSPKHLRIIDCYNIVPDS